MRFQTQVFARRAQQRVNVASLLLCVCGMFFPQGCAEKRFRARPWQTAMTIRPILPAAAPGFVPESPESYAPDLRWELPPLPAAWTTVRQPARPRVASQPAPEAAGNHKTATPSLEPELSAQETAAAQAQINESLAIAQRRLQAAKGRALNAMQTDLVSKVVSFLQESRQAAQEGDWMRARNLAKKAQVLSDELAASF